jgi:hypothetical protein
LLPHGGSPQDRIPWQRCIHLLLSIIFCILSDRLQYSSQFFSWEEFASKFITILFDDGIADCNGVGSPEPPLPILAYRNFLAEAKADGFVGICFLWKSLLVLVELWKCEQMENEALPLQKLPMVILELLDRMTDLTVEYKDPSKTRLRLTHEELRDGYHIRSIPLSIADKYGAYSALFDGPEVFTVGDICNMSSNELERLRDKFLEEKLFCKEDVMLRSTLPLLKRHILQRLPKRATPQGSNWAMANDGDPTHTAGQSIRSELLECGMSCVGEDVQQICARYVRDVSRLLDISDQSQANPQANNEVTEEDVICRSLAAIEIRKLGIPLLWSVGKTKFHCFVLLSRVLSYVLTTLGATGEFGRAIHLASRHSLCLLFCKHPTSSEGRSSQQEAHYYTQFRQLFFGITGSTMQRMVKSWVEIRLLEFRRLSGRESSRLPHIKNTCIHHYSPPNHEYI